MSAGERDMSVTKIWGPCGHNWLDFACYAGALDDDEEIRAVEAQVGTCEICLDELMEAIKFSALLYEVGSS
jgi:hypothetical protein